MIHPFLVIEIPFYGLLDTLLKLERWLPFVETADVVSLGNLTLVENHIDGTGMIHYIQPVAHILSLTIYRQWLAMTDVVDG